jgi:hypothetical protein
MDFNLMGTKVPLAYTIGAKKALLEAFGSTDALQAAFLTESDVELAMNAAKIGAIMANAEYDLQRAKSVLLGTEVTAKPIKEEDLFAVLDVRLTLDLIESITGTVRESNQTTFETKDEPGKKAEATHESE